MKRFFLFILGIFLAVLLPLMTYYGDAHTNNGSSQTWAYIWLGVSLFFTLLFLKKFFKWLLLGRRIQIKQMEDLMQNGTLITSTIIQCKQATPEFEGINKYELIVEFKNFVGSTVRERIDINDSHPERNSYVEGKSLKLRIDKALTNVPYLQVDGAHYKTPTTKATFKGAIIYLLVLAVITFYYYNAYMHEFAGPSWRFMVWYHPLIVSPVLLNILMLFSFPGNKLTPDQLQIKYYGYRTAAQVLTVAETGTYINDRPRVRFSVRYTDQYGKTVNTEFTKTIGVLEVGLTQQKTIDIFYIQKSPQKIYPAADIDIIDMRYV